MTCIKLPTNYLELDANSVLPFLNISKVASQQRCLLPKILIVLNRELYAFFNTA